MTLGSIGEMLQVNLLATAVLKINDSPGCWLTKLSLFAQDLKFDQFQTLHKTPNKVQHPRMLGVVGQQCCIHFLGA